MDETSTTAQLVGTPEMLAWQPGAVTTTVPREEIEEALASDPPAELVLEILRADGSNEVEKRTVNVAWDRGDLESVLTADAEAITFSFDPSELERALEPDVEGHGLREAAVVLSIAAAAAATGTSAAYGAPDPLGAGPAQVAIGGHDEASLAERGIGVQLTAASRDEAGLSARGIETPTAASHDEAGLTARGVEPGVVAASHDEAGLTARGVEPGVVAASHDEASLTARGIEPGVVAASHDEASLTARGIDPGYVAASHDEASLTARGIETGAEPVSVDTGGFELPSIEPATVAGIAGGLAGAGLLIAAASFAARRREPGTA
jgi:hypothetical protein